MASKHDDLCWTLVAKEIKGSVLQRKVLKILLKSKKKKKVNAQVLQKNVLVSVAEPVLHTL